jgi:hypothetical protein
MAGVESGNITGSVMGEGTQFKGPLTVELTSFITKVKVMIVELNWITETKVDNYGFDLVMSTFSRLLSCSATNYLIAI